MKIKYKMSGGICLTPCPNGMGVGTGKVNSMGCEDCEHFRSVDTENQILDCNHPEPKEAVDYEGVVNTLARLVVKYMYDCDICQAKDGICENPGDYDLERCTKTLINWAKEKQKKEGSEE